MKRLSLAAIFISLLYISCKKGGDELINTPLPTKVEPPVQEFFNYKSDRKYNLNVVYFVPKNITAPVDYHRRISEVILDFQRFYGNEMQRNGYGFKTFGLYKDDAKKRIRLSYITGKLDHTSYLYDGGSGNILKEIGEYKTLHPDEFTSEHTLIITPAYTYKADGTFLEAGPFYGLGKDCFGRDYNNMELKFLGTTGFDGTMATKYIGGTAHELGHGLNLPHNRQKYTSESFLVMALMWAGNGTYGKSATFLTEADCAVLNVNQVFNKDDKIYYGAVNSSIKKIKASYNQSTGNIVLSGKYTASASVTKVLYFNDPDVNNEGVGVNRDYNAIAWVSNPVNNDSFYVEMPVKDLQYKDDGQPYELKVKLVFDNGNVKETVYAYHFQNGVPVLNFGYKKELSKSGWSIKSVTSQEDTGPAVNLLDNNPDTYWHSQWKIAMLPYPHEIVIDLGSVIQNVNGLAIMQRANVIRAIKDAEVQISNDDISFTFTGNYVFQKIGAPQYFDFDSKKSFRYLKLICKNGWETGTYANLASLSEVGLY